MPTEFRVVKQCCKKRKFCAGIFFKVNAIFPNFKYFYYTSPAPAAQSKFEALMENWKFFADTSSNLENFFKSLSTSSGQSDNNL